MKKAAKLFLVVFVVAVTLIVSVLTVSATDTVLFQDTYATSRDFTSSDASQNCAVEFKNGALDFDNTGRTQSYFGWKSGTAQGAGTIIYTADISVKEISSSTSPYLMIYYVNKSLHPGFAVDKSTGKIVYSHKQTEVIYDHDVRNAGFITYAVKFDTVNKTFVLYVNGAQCRDGTLDDTQVANIANTAPLYWHVYSGAGSDNKVSIKNVKIYKTTDPYTVTIGGKLYRDGKLFNGTYNGDFYQNGVVIPKVDGKIVLHSDSFATSRTLTSADLVQNCTATFKDGALEFDNTGKTGSYFGYETSATQGAGTVIYSGEISVKNVSTSGMYLMAYRVNSTFNPGFIVNKDGKIVYNYKSDIVLYDKDVRNTGYMTYAVKFDTVNKKYALYINGVECSKGDLTDAQATNTADVAPIYWLLYSNGSDNTASIRNFEIYKTDEPYTVTIDGKLYRDGALFSGSYKDNYYKDGVKVSKYMLYAETFGTAKEWLKSTDTLYYYNAEGKTDGSKVLAQNCTATFMNGALKFDNTGKAGAYLAFGGKAAQGDGTIVYSADISIEKVAEGKSVSLMVYYADSKFYPSFVVSGTTGNLVSSDGKTVLVKKDLRNTGYHTFAVKFDTVNKTFALYFDGVECQTGALTDDQATNLATSKAPNYWHVYSSAADNVVNIKNVEIYKTVEPYTAMVRGKLYRDGEEFTGKYNGVEYKDGVCASTADTDVKASLSINENVGVNIYADLDELATSNEIDLNNASVYVRIGNYEMELGEASSFEALDTYKMTVFTSPAQLNDTITFTLSDGGKSANIVENYSVYQYCDYIINNYTDNDAVVDLCKALVNYGRAAQDAFADGYESGKLITDNYTLDFDVPVMTATKLTDPDVIDPRNISFLALDKSGVRFYFNAEAGEDISINVGKTGLETGSGVVNGYADEDYTIVAGTMNYVQVEKIEAADLNTKFTVTVNGVQYVYSALRCVYDLATINPAFTPFYNALADYYMASAACFSFN